MDVGAHLLFSAVVWLAAFGAVFAFRRFRLGSKPFPRNLIASGAAGYAFFFVLVGVIADPNGVHLFERNFYEASVIVVGVFLVAPIFALDAFFGAPSFPASWLAGAVLILAISVGAWKRQFQLARFLSYVSLALWWGTGTAWVCYQA